MLGALIFGKMSWKWRMSRRRMERGQLEEEEQEGIKIRVTKAI
jgi:hypothetical protein